jgi:hypothetical protein
MLSQKPKVPVSAIHSGVVGWACASRTFTQVLTPLKEGECKAPFQSHNVTTGIDLRFFFFWKKKNG